MTPWRDREETQPHITESKKPVRKGTPPPTSIQCRIAIVLDALEKAELTEMTAGSVVPESGVGEDLGQ